MSNRFEDWLKQAERDLEHARESSSAGRHEWACFAAHQSAEKAVKALHLRLGQEAWGHVIRQLLEDLPPSARASLSAEFLDKARVLDGYYIPTRYPNGHPSGAPGEHYGQLQSQEAILYASEILEFSRSQMA